LRTGLQAKKVVISFYNRVLISEGKYNNKNLIKFRIGQRLSKSNDTKNIQNIYPTLKISIKFNRIKLNNLFKIIIPTIGNNAAGIKTRQQAA
jgi:hypothetical protein